MYRPLIAELFLDNAESDRNAIHLYLSQPTPLEEKNLGKIFVILEFNDPQRYTEEIIERITSAFSESYYRSSDFEVEAAFERALQKVNQAVKDGISEYGEEWVYTLNAIIGVIHETSVYFTYVGSMEAFLVQGQEIIDVIQKPKDNDIKPLKLFTNIIAGQCPEKCAMLFSTSNLLDYLSLEKIRRIVKELEPEHAVAQFESTLTETTALSNIAGIVLTTEKGSAIQSEVVAPEDELEKSEFSEVEDSMERLITQEQLTGDLLAPSIWPTIKKRLNSVSGSRANATAGQETQRTSLNYARSQNKGVAILMSVLTFLKNVGIQIIVGLTYIGKHLLRIFNERDSISSKVGSSVNGATNWFTRLSGPRKIFLGLFILVLVIFVISIAVKDKSVEKAETTQTYEATLTDIENKLGEIESKKIMNDEGGARTLVAEAEALLNTVPKDEASIADRVTNLQNRINEYNNTFNKVTVLSNLTEVGNFNSISPEASANYITKIGDNIYGFDSANTSIYRINLSTNDVSNVTSASDEDYRSVENDSVATTLALLDNGSFVQFNPVLEKTTAVDAADLPDGATVVDFDLFADRLYTLDTTTKQIYRQQQSGDTYGQPVEWLTEDIDLSGAVSLDIDSSIYVLLNSGEIIKLDGGTRSQFSVDEFGPSLAGASKLIKESATSPFYIANPTTQRVVILDSEGNLDKQLTGDQFANLKDIYVDEANSALYVLAGSSVYEIAL